nr:PREDICTED: uncharacterized protein LOC109040471 [Bemisia tabaci]
MSETNGPSCSREAAFQSKGNVYKCGFCKKKGHKWADCYLRKNSSTSSKHEHHVHLYQDGSTLIEHSSDIEDQASDSSQDVAFTSSVGAFNNEEEMGMTWILDSGATEHLCNDERWFTTLEKLDPPISIAIAKDDQTLSASHIGTISVTLDTGKTQTILQTDGGEAVGDSLPGSRPLKSFSTVGQVTDNSKLIHQVFESVKDDATRIRLITALMAEKGRTYAAQANVIEKMTGDIRELQLEKRKLHDELSIVLAATIVEEFEKEFGKNSKGLTRRQKFTEILEMKEEKPIAYLVEKSKDKGLRLG